MRIASRFFSALAAVTLLGAFAPAPSARALTIEPNPFFVLPVEFDPSHGSIELVEVVSGVPTGGTVLGGTVDPGDVTLVLRADILGATSGLLYIGIRTVGTSSDFVPFTGVGWIPGADVDIDSAVSSGPSDPATVGFLPEGGPVSAGQSYDLVFLSYEALAEDGSLELVVGLQIVPETVGTATLVPEPGSAALLAVGVALLATCRRRA